MITLTEDQKKASDVKTVVAKEEAIANKKAEETKVIADDAQKDLDQALPALRAANKVRQSSYMFQYNCVHSILTFVGP